MHPFAKLKRLFRSQSGLAYLEFGLTLPFLMLLFMGGLEVTRYIITTQKVEKTAITIADLVAQSTKASATSLNTLLSATEEMMMPYSFSASGYVIITSVSKSGVNSPVINWQYSGGGTRVKTSRIGHTGGTPALPAGFTMNDKENAIIAEVFYLYTPLLGESVIQTTEVYKTAILRPRLGALSALGG